MKRLVGRLAASADWARAAGLAQLELLLFVRDPIEHASSLYLEMVKAHGYADSLGSWLSIYDLPLHVQAFVSEQAPLGATTLQVHNYSRCQRAILPLLQAWLQLPEQAARWPLPPRQRVNRSLSGRELQLMLRLNRRLGRRAGAIGRALVHWRPRARPAQPQASAADRAALGQRLEPVLAAINQHLPPDQQLQSNP